MAEARFCVGFSSACKQARAGGGLPAYEGRESRGRFLHPFLPPDIVRLIDALVRRLAHEDTLLCMNGGELGRTLCEAAAAGGLRDVRFLLARGADVEQTTAFVYERGIAYGWNALMWAAWFGHLAVSVALLDAGADERECALYAASFQGHTLIMALLLDRGVDIHSNDEEALAYAAQEDHLAAAMLLLDRGADIHAQEDRQLIMAAQKGHIEIVRLLRGARCAGAASLKQLSHRTPHIQH
jgi:ankyrin repeat protein